MPRQPSVPDAVALPRLKYDTCAHVEKPEHENLTMPYVVSHTYALAGNVDPAAAADSAKPPIPEVTKLPDATHVNARVGVGDDGAVPHDPAKPRQYVPPLFAVAYRVRKATAVAKI